MVLQHDIWSLEFSLPYKALFEYIPNINPKAFYPRQKMSLSSSYCRCRHSHTATEKKIFVVVTWWLNQFRSLTGLRFLYALLIFYEKCLTFSWRSKRREWGSEGGASTLIWWWRRSKCLLNPWSRACEQ